MEEEGRGRTREGEGGKGKERGGEGGRGSNVAPKPPDQTPPMVSILTRDIDIANLSVCLSVCP